MHDLSAQQPRIPHAIRNVPQTALRQAGYEVVLYSDGTEHVAPFASSVTKAIDNAKQYIFEKLPTYIL